MYSEDSSLRQIRHKPCPPVAYLLQRTLLPRLPLAQHHEEKDVVLLEPVTRDLAWSGMASLRRWCLS